MAGLWVIFSGNRLSSLFIHRHGWFQDKWTEANFAIGLYQWDISIFCEVIMTFISEDFFLLVLHPCVCNALTTPWIYRLVNWHQFKQVPIHSTKTILLYSWNVVFFFFFSFFCSGTTQGSNVYQKNLFLLLTVGMKKTFLQSLWGD